jgi:hypothetical protein
VHGAVDVLATGLAAPYHDGAGMTMIEDLSIEHLFERGGIFYTSNMTSTIFMGAMVGSGAAVNWSASIRTPKRGTDTTWLVDAIVRGAVIVKTAG